MKALANGTFLKTYPSKWLDVKVPLMFYERIEEIKKRKKEYKKKKKGHYIGYGYEQKWNS